MDRRSLLGLMAAVAGGGSSAMGGFAGPARPAGFVTRGAGGQLAVDGRPFRYIGANMPEVTHIRTDWDLEQGDRFRLPIRREIDWMVEAAAQAGFQVIRTWCFPSFLQPENPESTHYFRRNADGRTVTLNEAGFTLFDYFLARCGALGVRAQVPFVYLPAVREWADEAGNPHPQLLDFSRQVVTRINRLTGIAYRDDPSIFCWESGNEPRPSARWVRGLAAHVKALSPRQLFMDGRDYLIDVWSSYQDRALLADEHIDLVSPHLYKPAPNGWSHVRAIGEFGRTFADAGKALDIGEISPRTDVGELAPILEAIVRSPAAGGSWWSFKGARAKGGYTHWNGREWGAGDDLKWPGPRHPLPGARAEKAKIDLLSAAAYRIAGHARPARLPRPTPATLLPIADPGHISWIPGTGEQVADIQRSTRPDSGFRTVKAGFETFLASTYAMFCDESAVPGQSYFYRVVSRNNAEAARPSNIVGPAAARTRWMIEDFWSLDRTARVEGCRSVSDYDAIPYHGDLSVLVGEKDGARIDYALAGVLRSLLLIANRDTDTIIIEGSEDGVAFARLPVDRRVHPPLHPEFAGYPRVTYRVRDGGGVRHIRLNMGPSDILSRLEIEHA